MKYFIDTEFHEFKKKVLPWSKGINTIDLISIGIVAEDDREYYAISKDFDLKAAWNSWQPRTGQGDRNNIEPKEYWLRENVLEPIFHELNAIHNKTASGIRKVLVFKFSYPSLLILLHWYGKSNIQISAEIHNFTLHGEVYFKEDSFRFRDPEFYAYYADYDWVVFCWLFGRMIDLPNGFPMYCIDLKQISDEIYKKQKSIHKAKFKIAFIDSLEEHLYYPKQTDEHNALADAKWNKKLHKFISNL